MIRFRVFATTKLDFNYFGHSHKYDTTIEIFMLLVGWILGLFSFINSLICPINHNSHQITLILKVLYGHKGVYFYYALKLYL
jgi:hypothetical protein